MMRLWEVVADPDVAPEGGSEDVALNVACGSHVTKQVVGITPSLSLYYLHRMLAGERNRNYLIGFYF